MSSDDVKEIKACDLGRFQFKRVLSDDPHAKVSFIEGRFEGGEEPAVVILEKTPFSEETCAKILTQSDNSGESEGPEGAQETFRNDIYSGYTLQPVKALNEIKATVIYPATEKHIEKYSRQEVVFTSESAQLYKDVVAPYLSDNCFSVQWVYNVLEHKKEQESILMEDTDPKAGFMLCKDMKWDMKQTEDLHCLALVHDRSLRSIRDLRARHLPLLRNMRQRTIAFLADRYGLGADKLVMYFHYQPSYYHLHLHVVAVTFENPPGGSCQRGHLLEVVMSNLEICDDFYEKATLCYTLKKNDALNKVIQNYSSNQQQNQPEQGSAQEQEETK